MLVLEPEAFSSFLYYDQDMVGRLENESKLECFCRENNRRGGRANDRIYRHCVIDYEQLVTWQFEDSFVASGDRTAENHHTC
jgi:hypothetical protein